MGWGVGFTPAGELGFCMPYSLAKKKKKKYIKIGSNIYIFGNYSQRTGMFGHVLVILVWKHCSRAGE